MPTNPNCYWNNNGRYQALADQLQRLIPLAGEIPNAKEGPKLERFRKAVNVYYDVFNNGCCNRAREFKPTFGLRLSDYKRQEWGIRGRYQALDFDGLMADLEDPMSRYILEAAAEQLGGLEGER